MADGLAPLSGSRRAQFCGWSATLVDALDTLYIMGLSEEFEEAVNATVTIDFAHNAQFCSVSLFESTIRYLGGLLAAYDLSGERRLLPKLVELGNVLHSAFDTHNGMPCSYCRLASGTGEAFFPSSDIAMADVGSLYLEFARLSQITNDDKYMSSVAHVTYTFAQTQNDSSVPGLWPELVDSSSIDGENRMFARKSFRYSLGALSDSSYEYLVKGHLLLGQMTDLYQKMWEAASAQIKRYLLFRAYVPGSNESDIIFPGIATRYPDAGIIRLESRTEHLACFAGGMFALASRIFDEPADLVIGEQITNGCVWAYMNSPSGIMPETFTALPCAGAQQCEWNETFWEEESHRPANCRDELCDIFRFPPGFLQVGDTTYKLRPEAIESVFIMWRTTGDEYWRDVGWTMFENIIEHTRSPFGHAALVNVMETVEQTRYERGVAVTKDLVRQQDDMESFWFSETLKYFYLLFSDPSLIDLDQWVLNTEAHPLRLTDDLRGF